MTDGVYTYVWDAEGKQTSAQYMNTTPELYFYDGDGNRVEK